MTIDLAEAFQAMMPPGSEEDDTPRKRVSSYRAKILEVNGEHARNQRKGSAPTHTTLGVLRASIDRGHLVPVDSVEA